MSKTSRRGELEVVGGSSCGACCNRPAPRFAESLSRRRFLQGIGAAGVAIGGIALPAADSRAARLEPVGGEPFPRGARLRVKPILVYDVPERKDRTSWRGYGAVHTHEAAREEAGRIEKELRALEEKVEFPIEF